MEILNNKNGSQLYKEFEIGLYRNLTDRGYSRVLYNRRPIYVKPLGMGLYGAVGNATSRPSSKGVCVYMHLGVAHDKAERLLYDMTIESAVIKTEYIGPIAFQYGISDLSKRGKYQDYERILRNDYDVQQAIQFITKVVDDLVEPFFSRFNSLEYYLDFIKHNAIIGYRDKIIPIVLYLNGDKKQGIEYIESRLRDKKKRGYTDINDSVFLEKYFSLPDCLES